MSPFSPSTKGWAIHRYNIDIAINVSAIHFSVVSVGIVMFFFFFKKIYFTFLMITNELLLNVFCLFCYSFADSLLAIYF